MTVGTRLRIAMVCLGIPAISELGIGLVYLFAAEAMPYHVQAMGVSWPELTPGVRATVRTLLNGYGSTHLAVGVALGVLILGPLRRGQGWARWAILAVGLPVFAGTAVFSSRLAAVTGAHVPWEGAVGLLVLFVIGVALASPDRPAARSSTP